MKFNQKKIFGIDLDSISLDERIKKESVKSEDEVLVIDTSEGNIYAWDGEKLKKIVKRDKGVRALAVWRGELYDCGSELHNGNLYGKIYRTRDSKLIKERIGAVTDLEAWRSELYDGNSFGEIYRTRDNEIIAGRSGAVWDLKVWRGELYDCGYYGEIYRTRDRKIEVTFDGPTYCMLPVKRNIESKAEDEVLVIGNKSNIYAWDGKKLKVIKERDDEVYALAVWNNELYDGCANRIYRTMNSKLEVELGEPVTCMLPVKKSVLRG